MEREVEEQWEGVWDFPSKEDWIRRTDRTERRTEQRVEGRGQDHISKSLNVFAHFPVQQEKLSNSVRVSNQSSFWRPL